MACWNFLFYLYEKVGMGLQGLVKKIDKFKVMEHVCCAFYFFFYYKRHYNYIVLIGWMTSENYITIG